MKAKKKNLTEAAILDLLGESYEEQMQREKHCKAKTIQIPSRVTQGCSDFVGNIEAHVNTDGNKRTGDIGKSIKGESSLELGLNVNRKKAITSGKAEGNAVKGFNPDPFSCQSDRSVGRFISIIARKKPHALCDDKPNPCLMARWIIEELIALILSL